MSNNTIFQCGRCGHIMGHDLTCSICGHPYTKILFTYSADQICELETINKCSVFVKVDVEFEDINENTHITKAGYYDNVTVFIENGDELVFVDSSKGDDEYHVLPLDLIGITVYIVSNGAINNPNKKVVRRTYDIKSTGNYPENVLSNMADNRFTFDGVYCKSMESLLQSFKYPNENMQRHICSMKGHVAKSNGVLCDWRSGQDLYWKGVKYKRNSKEYQELLDRAFEALLTNSSFARALQDTGRSKLTHSIGKTNSTRTILTENEFISRLYKLRKSLQKETDNMKIDLRIDELRHPKGVGVIVIKNGRVLLGKRKDSSEWCIAGGKIEEGESPKEAAIRELQEEFGIIVNDITYYGVCPSPINKSDDRDRIHGCSINYFVVIPDEELVDINLQETEVTDFDWIKLDEVLNLDPMFSSTRYSLELFLEVAKIGKLLL